MVDFTRPDQGLTPRKMTDQELARAIMLDISAELDAISLYDTQIATTDNKLAKKVLAHIRDEEKEHLGEFLTLLETLDPTIGASVKEAAAQVEMFRKSLRGNSK